MKDYERYMSRQRLSETGMARLVRLETERPQRGERTGKQGTGRSGWMKYAGLAACLVLAVGLLVPPALQGLRQIAGPSVTDEPVEELYFHEMPIYQFYADEAVLGKKTDMKPADAAALFGSSPDDFVGLLETVGLEKYDMEYYTVDLDMETYPFGVAPQVVGGYHFLMEGSYVSPRVKPDNWDETSDIPWEMAVAASSFWPGNDVWLEIWEGHSYLEKENWAALETRPFHGHQVAAARDANTDYYAAAAFDVESGGKTYGVFYSVVSYGEANAQELVTKMVSYITQNGLFIQDRAEAQVKTTGRYVMETAVKPPVEGILYTPVVNFREDGSCGIFVDYVSSHMCQSRYQVVGGQVTTDCKQHHYVFDIVDENTLRFVGAQSSEPERYGTSLPKITDGAVFRWEEIIYDTPLDDQRAQLEGDIVDAKEGGNVNVWVWGDGTHHSEPKHPVEPTHHPEPSHHIVGITEIDWTDGRWIADDQFASNHHSDHH